MVMCYESSLVRNCCAVLLSHLRLYECITKNLFLCYKTYAIARISRFLKITVMKLKCWCSKTVCLWRTPLPIKIKETLERHIFGTFGHNVIIVSGNYFSLSVTNNLLLMIKLMKRMFLRHIWLACSVLTLRLTKAEIQKHNIKKWHEFIK
jgi:hypothetical protein